MKIAVVGRVIEAEAEALGLGEAGIAALRGIRRVRDDPDRLLPSEARALLELRAAILSWPPSPRQSCRRSRCTRRDECEAQLVPVDVVLPGRIELSLCVVDIEVRAAR